MKLRIGHLSTFYHTSILMIALGNVEERLGASVEWKLLGTGPAIVSAFEKGEIDIAYMGLPPAIIGIDRGIGITCIAGGHIEGTVISGSDQFTGFPSIRDPGKILKQFSGLKIGVPAKGSIHDVIISDCLDRFHLEGEVGIVNFKWADQILDAAKKGDVSAAVGTPALAVALRHFLQFKILYPPSKLWPNNPSYGILADKTFLTKERDTVQRFLSLHEESALLLRNRTSEAAQIISGYTGIVDQDFVLETLKLSPRYCAMITDDYISATMQFVKTLKKLKYIRGEISAEEIFDASLINEIHPSADHYGVG